ncbi:MAG: carboxypeptidase regulatory-like domain-containing protein [Gemmatimonadaceae bacterium]
MQTSKARRTLCATVFCFTITPIATALFPVALPGQNSAPAAAVGRITGTMFDSLAMLPLAGASIWIHGTTHTATTDSRGRFELDSLPIGSHTLAYSSPSLDSLGFGTQGRDVQVSANATSHVSLTVPSLQTFWRTFCKNRPRLGADSGIVWGTVKNAETSTLYDGASALFSWYDMQSKGKTVEFAQMSTEVRSDSTGTYYACGLPIDVAISARALGRNAASGEVEYAIGKHSVYHVNLSVSPDMVVSMSADSGSLRNGASSTVVRGRGRSVLRGSVRDDHNRAVPEALVSVASADTVVRTSKDGTYLLSGMPAGTHSVQIRSLGFAMTSKLVDLKPNATTELNFMLSTTTVLATYNVRTESKPSLEYLDYQDRRQMSAGYAREFGDLAFADGLSILDNIPRTYVGRQNGSAEVYQWVTNAAGSRVKCNPVLYLDGAPVDANFMETYPVGNLRAVEVFDKFQVPIRYMGSSVNSCGAILYWTSDRWKKE